MSELRSVDRFLAHPLVRGWITFCLAMLYLNTLLFLVMGVGLVWASMTGRDLGATVRDPTFVLGLVAAVELPIFGLSVFLAIWRARRSPIEYDDNVADASAPADEVYEVPLPAPVLDAEAIGVETVLTEPLGAKPEELVGHAEAVARSIAARELEELTQAQPLDLGLPPTDDEIPFITTYLAKRDVPCPACRGSLRGAQSNHCPECGYRLTLGRLIADQRTEQ